MIQKTDTHAAQTLGVVQELSEVRLSAYKKKNSEEDNHCIAMHQWNVQIGEAMKPSLSYFELLLRNHINAVFKHCYGDDWLLSVPVELCLSQTDRKKNRECERDFIKTKKRKPRHDDILSRMSLGFWTAFFHKKYDSFWFNKEHWRIVFPYLPRRFCKRKYIEPKIKQIKNLRNRIAHLEPVWDLNPPINQIHYDCLEIIGYMSKDVLDLVKEIDRFNNVMKDKP